MGVKHLNHWEMAIAVERARLLEHPVYQSLAGPAEVITFLQHHVWAVWDFMSLLKALQRRLTGVSLPWMPPTNSFAARLINEIVLGEETDADGEGGHLSHFELYLRAMVQAGANVGPIERFMARLTNGIHWVDALQAGESEIPQAACGFVAHHLRLAESGSLAAVAGAFTLAREGVIPDMFNRVLIELGDKMPDRFGHFAFYLRRHIEIDGDEHGPAAAKLLDYVTAGSQSAADEAIEAAAVSLRLRGNLYDAILAAL